MRSNPKIQQKKVLNSLYFQTTGTQHDISHALPRENLSRQQIRAVQKSTSNLELRGKKLKVSEMGHNLHGNKTYGVAFGTSKPSTAY